MLLATGGTSNGRENSNYLTRRRRKIWSGGAFGALTARNPLEAGYSWEIRQFERMSDLTIRPKSDSKKYNKTPGHHGTNLRKEQKPGPIPWMAKLDRKFRYMVKWDAVHNEWAPKKMTLNHVLAIAEELAGELLTKPDAKDLRDAKERSRKIYETIHGIEQSLETPPIMGSTKLMLGGRGQTADEMRQNRRTDNGV